MGVARVRGDRGEGLGWRREEEGEEEVEEGESGD